ncbi:TVP38/TMEM64 family protein [Pseudactinotalea sp. Z1748]|uniref:TVP38/TMEM64 family protein n=1 Tax=Pseudactinotalea sp. Z1748 TaxID=3413027 RepID=UPI003C7A5A54
MAVSAGVLFGVLEGSILSVTGVLIGCWGAYWLARGLGMSTVERMLGRHGPTVKDRLSSKGFHAVYTLRLMPGVPYWPVNYGSGAFGVSQRDFVVASALSAIPGQVSLVAVGAFVADPTPGSGAVVAIAWILVLSMTIWAWRSWKGTSRRPLPGAGFR